MKLMHIANFCGWNLEVTYWYEVSYITLIITLIRVLCSLFIKILFKICKCTCFDKKSLFMLDAS